MIDLLGGDPTLRQAVGDRLHGKSGVVLLAGEAFFLRRGHDLAVPDQACGRVVVIGRYAQDMHAGLA